MNPSEPSSKTNQPAIFNYFNPASLITNIRFYILSFSLTLSIVLYLYVSNFIPEGTLQNIRLTQYYALTAITYLYIAILATPLTKLFTFFPFRAKYIKARRAIGVSAFYFGLLHASLAFFGQLGGFPGLFFLSNTYLLAIALSSTALLILFLMASTSFDYMIAKLTFPRWKSLHRFVYLAGVFILIHALLLGTHFADLSGLIPQICLAALGLLLILEAIRVDKYLATKFSFLPSIGLSVVLIIIILTAVNVYLLVPQSGGLVSFDIHAQHLQLAQQAQQGNIPGGNSSLSINPLFASNPAFQGDPTRRFTVSFNHSDTTTNPNANLNFQVYDANSGNQIQLFSKVYEKPAHLIIVDSSLSYFAHIHPDQTVDGFQISHIFPQNGKYHLYMDFQPLGAIEQQFGFTLNVGSNISSASATQAPDTNLTKTFDKYQVSLSYPTPLKASELSLGKQKLTFEIKDAASGQPITTLKPYLASFGHLVMINQSTYEYLHVHPTNITPPAPNSNGGPIVEFLPLGLYGPIKPGIYRVFAQFNPDNNLFTAYYTVKVE